MTHEPQRTRQDETPLQGWKEIAAYLGRTERTAKLWEKEERLPVHRQQHKLRPSVYAYPSELDTWRAARQPGAAAVPVPLWRRPLPAAALTGLLLLSLLTVGNGPHLGSVMAAGMVTRQVWAGPEVDTFGAASYDGRYLSYTNWSTGDLWVRDLRSGENRNLTNHGSLGGGGAHNSVPSRDGTQIAYAWWDSSERPYSLRVVGLDGSEPRILIPGGEYWWLVPEEWSPGGKHILATLYRNDHTQRQIALVSVANGAVRVLKTLVWGSLREPIKTSFSPDGRYIAYNSPPRRGAEEDDIFVLAADGSGETSLVKHPADDFVLGWAPDGSGVLFASNRTGSQAAWFIRVADGRPQGSPVLVKPDLPDRIFPLGFTRDGAYYYGVEGLRADVYLATLDPETGKVLGEPSKVPLRDEGYITHLDWSPDGRRLAYLLRDFPRTRLSVLDLQTSEQRQFELGFLVRVGRARPRWSLDGRSLLLVGCRESKDRCPSRVDARTGETTVLLRAEAGEEFSHTADWSPDGRAIFFTREKVRSAPSIFVRDLGTGEEEELQQVPWGHGRLLEPSPDGRQLAFVQRGTLMLMPTAGGELRELYKPGHTIGSLAWTPDGRHLIVGTRTQNFTHWEV